MGDSYRDRIQDGLKKIQKVLNCIHDEDRIKMLNWTQDSVNALLQGEWVMLPIGFLINTNQRKNDE